jgi:hypothetical protein
MGGRCLGGRRCQWWRVWRALDSLRFWLARRHLSLGGCHLPRSGQGRAAPQGVAAAQDMAHLIQQPLIFLSDQPLLIKQGFQALLELALEHLRQVPEQPLQIRQLSACLIEFPLQRLQLLRIVRGLVIGSVLGQRLLSSCCALEPADQEPGLRLGPNPARNRAEISD